jgi:hypothetical protein
MFILCVEDQGENEARDNGEPEVKAVHVDEIRINVQHGRIDRVQPVKESDIQRSDAEEGCRQCDVVDDFSFEVVLVSAGRRRVDLDPVKHQLDGNGDVEDDAQQEDDVVKQISFVDQSLAFHFWVRADAQVVVERLNPGQEDENVLSNKTEAVYPDIDEQVPEIIFKL